MRPERRRLKLHARASPTLVHRPDVAAFAKTVRACVLAKTDDGRGPAARRPLQQLAAAASAPLAACLADVGALYRGRDGATQKVALEAPFLSYDARAAGAVSSPLSGRRSVDAARGLSPRYEPYIPRPEEGEAADGYDRTWVDVLLVAAIVFGALFGAYKLLAKSGLFAAACGPSLAIPIRARRAADGDDDLYARLSSPTHGRAARGRAEAATELAPAPAPRQTPPTDYRDRPAEQGAGFV